MRDLLKRPELLHYVLDTMVEGLFLLDKDLTIQYMNSSALQIMDGFLSDDDYHGRNFYDYVHMAPIDFNEEGTSILIECMETGTSLTRVMSEHPNGKTLSINVVPIVVDNEKRGLMLTMEDVTKLIEIEKELDMAFALTLPNSKVEHKMKTTVEYQDEYNPELKNIRVTGIIKDGVYRHVVNSLKIFSSLAAQGVTKVIGIDKDQLVQAIIFHDLGKVQPDLMIGEVVDPREVFEDSKLHAYRSAEIAKNLYHQPDDVVELIRFHHHSEKEASESLPWRLLPMFRLFQLIDGLSAAVTRGGVDVLFTVSGSSVIVTEHNRRPKYDGTRKIDLFTGKRRNIE